MTKANPNGVLEVGRELDQHGNIKGPVGVPISEINRHLLITGATGSGKSTTAVRAIQSGHRRTEGATIAVDPKGDWANHLLRHHYAVTNSLDDVLYFDVGSFLPALAFFDLRGDIASNRDRGKAMREIIDHFFDILEALLQEGDTAVRSPDVIKYIIRALFDPIEGADAFTIEALVETLYTLRRERKLPNVSVPETESLLRSITDADARMFDTILQGSLTRVEKFYGSGYLRPIFNHVPTDHDDAFTFEGILNKDLLVVFNLGGVPTTGQRVIANTILSLLWKGLKRRFSNPDEYQYQSLLVVDEVPQLHIHNRLIDLLSLSRGYKLGVIPMMQYPSQLRSRGSQAAYEEILNNCRSILAGQVADASGLVNRLSGSTMSEAEAQNRLLNLHQDKWLFKPATPRDIPTIPTHLIADIRLPAGLSGSDKPLSDGQQTRFRTQLEAVQEQTEDEYGIPYEKFTEESVNNSPALQSDQTVSKHTVQALQESSFSTTLPLLNELPEMVTFDSDRNVVRCDQCSSKRSPDAKGFYQALLCHTPQSEISQSQIPPVELHLSLTEAEMLEAPVNLRPLLWLQIVLNISRNRYSLVEFDPVLENLTHLQEMFGVTEEHIAELEDAGLLRVERIRELKFHTVSPNGRELLQEPHKENVEWGHSKGDLNETYLHQVMVSALVRYIQQEYRDDPDSNVETVVPYYEPDRMQVFHLDQDVRFDVVGLSDSKEIVVIGEAERVNKNIPSVIHDYQKIADVEPNEEAIWIAPSDSKAHEIVLEPLANPTEYIDQAEFSIKEYSRETRMKDINGLDSPGISDILTLTNVRNTLQE